MSDVREADTRLRPKSPPFGRTVRVGQDFGMPVDMHWIEAGEGPPLILVHGSGPGAGGYANFSGNIPVLAAAGYRVIVPDLPGFGWSDKPDDFEYTTDFFVETFKDFLDALGIEKAPLVGNSLGGAIVTAFALKYPDRVPRLVMMATGGIETRERYFQMDGMQTMVSRFVGDGYDATTMEQVLKLLAFDPKFVTPEMVESRMAVYLTQPKNVLGRITIPDMTDRLQELEMPILGFWGWEDRFCPATGAEKIVAACPNAQVTLFSRCGHWVMIERANDFNRAVLQFLAD